MKKQNMHNLFMCFYNWLKWKEYTAFCITLIDWWLYLFYFCDFVGERKEGKANHIAIILDKGEKLMGACFGRWYNQINYDHKLIHFSHLSKIDTGWDHPPNISSRENLSAPSLRKLHPKTPSSHLSISQVCWAAGNIMALAVANVHKNNSNSIS